MAYNSTLILAKERVDRFEATHAHLLGKGATRKPRRKEYMAFRMISESFAVGLAAFIATFTGMLITLSIKDGGLASVASDGAQFGRVTRFFASLALIGTLLCLATVSLFTLAIRSHYEKAKFVRFTGFAGCAAMLLIDIGVLYLYWNNNWYVRAIVFVLVLGQLVTTYVRLIAGRRGRGGGRWSWLYVHSLLSSRVVALQAAQEAVRREVELHDELSMLNLQQEAPIESPSEASPTGAHTCSSGASWRQRLIRLSGPRKQGPR